MNAQDPVYRVYRAPSASGGKDWAVCYHPNGNSTVRWGKSGALNQVRHYTPIDYEKVRRTERDKEHKGYRFHGEFRIAAGRLLSPAPVATPAPRAARHAALKPQPRAAKVDWDALPSSQPSVFF